MKVLVVFMMSLVLVGCNGGAQNADGNSSTTLGTNKSTVSLYFESQNVWRNTGVDTVPYDVDDSATFIIPSQIVVTRDSDSSIVNGDIATITFVNNECRYSFDGDKFVFSSCGGDLTGYYSGDSVKLKNLEEPSFPTLNGRVKIGLIRASNNLHTGYINLLASLEHQALK